jgi:hypothetical protein
MSAAPPASSAAGGAGSVSNADLFRAAPDYDSLIKPQPPKPLEHTMGAYFPFKITMKKKRYMMQKLVNTKKNLLYGTLS